MHQSQSQIPVDQAVNRGRWPSSEVRGVRRQDPSCLRLILVELGLQRFNTTELLSVPKPCDEVDSHGGIVQIQVRVEQVCFHHRLGIAEGWPRPQVQHPVVRSHGSLRTDRVDTFGWKQLPSAGHRHVCRRKTEQPPATGALDDPAAQRVAATQSTKRAVQISACYGTPYGGRGN